MHYGFKAKDSPDPLFYHFANASDREINQQCVVCDVVNSSGGDDSATAPNYVCPNVIFAADTKSALGTKNEFNF
ncbi:hypothetical protein GCM10007973_31220 [Polymorphobacter multimanifer]|nr:hypothetical protein GCM10007973_31220 [Polymorphobacter multimanifer]